MHLLLGKGYTPTIYFKLIIWKTYKILRINFIIYFFLNSYQLKIKYIKTRKLLSC